MANLLNTIFKIGELSIFSNAIAATNLDKIIDEKYEFTIFAPNDLAFAQIPNVNLNILLADIGLLTAILSIHIIPGRMSSHNLLKMCKPGEREVILTSIDSSHIYISLIDGIAIGEATVLSTDTMPSNGIVHIIDQVLMPAAIG
jgi:uncharacterized surface protein with fasciclin (FAS1) repeats